MQGQKPDERIRTPMQWTGEATGGFTTAKPWESLQDDVETDTSTMCALRSRGIVSERDNAGQLLSSTAWTTCTYVGGLVIWT